MAKRHHQSKLGLPAAAIKAPATPPTREKRRRHHDIESPTRSRTSLSREMVPKPGSQDTEENVARPTLLWDNLRIEELMEGDVWTRRNDVKCNLKGDLHSFLQRGKWVEPKTLPDSDGWVGGTKGRKKTRPVYRLGDDTEAEYDCRNNEYLWAALQPALRLCTKVLGQKSAFIDAVVRPWDWTKADDGEELDPRNKKKWTDQDKSNHVHNGEPLFRFQITPPTDGSDCLAEFAFLRESFYQDIDIADLILKHVKKRIRFHIQDFDHDTGVITQQKWLPPTDTKGMEEDKSDGELLYPSYLVTLSASEIFPALCPELSRSERLAASFRITTLILRGTIDAVFEGVQDFLQGSSSFENVTSHGGVSLYYDSRRWDLLREKLEYLPHQILRPYFEHFPEASLGHAFESWLFGGVFGRINPCDCGQPQPSGPLDTPPYLLNLRSCSAGDGYYGMLLSDDLKGNIHLPVATAVPIYILEPLFLEEFWQIGVPVYGFDAWKDFDLGGTTPRKIRAETADKLQLPTRLQDLSLDGSATEQLKYALKDSLGHRYETLGQSFTQILVDSLVEEQRNIQGATCQWTMAYKTFPARAKRCKGAVDRLVEACQKTSHLLKNTLDHEARDREIRDHGDMVRRDIEEVLHYLRQEHVLYATNLHTSTLFLVDDKNAQTALRFFYKTWRDDVSSLQKLCRVLAVELRCNRAHEDTIMLFLELSSDFGTILKLIDADKTDGNVREWRKLGAGPGMAAIKLSRRTPAEHLACLIQSDSIGPAEDEWRQKLLEGIKVLVGKSKAYTFENLNDYCSKEAARWQEGPTYWQKYLDLGWSNNKQLETVEGILDEAGPNQGNPPQNPGEENLIFSHGHVLGGSQDEIVGFVKMESEDGERGAQDGEPSFKRRRIS